MGGWGGTLRPIRAMQDIFGVDIFGCIVDEWRGGLSCGCCCDMMRVLF